MTRDWSNSNIIKVIAVQLIPLIIPQSLSITAMSNPIPNSTASNPTPPEGGNSSSYSPSVPISLYREVTAELQSSQNLINSLRTQNQQLLEENQNLRQELNNVVQAANQFYLAVESVQRKNQPSSAVPPVNPSFGVNPVSAPPNFYEQPRNEIPQPDAVFPPNRDAPDTPPPQFTEEPEGRLRPSSGPDRGELSGIWLIVSMALIVIAAFGMGYWVVRPLLQQQGR